MRFPGFDEPWIKSEFHEFAEVNPKCQSIPEQFYYIDLGSVEDGELCNMRVEDAHSAPSRAQRLLSKDDILFQTVRPYQQNNYLFCNENELPTVASTGYAVLRTKCDVQYLYALIHTKHFLSSVLSRCTGTSFPAVSASDIEDIITWTTAIDEQRKIGELFRLLNIKIAKQKALVNSLKKYKRGLLQQIFSRKLKMSVGGESWEYILLGEIGCFFGGLTGKSKENFDHGDSKFITYMNVYKNTFADETMVTAVDVLPNERQNAVRYGDILFTQSSETVEEVGLTSVWVHDTTPYLNSFCMALRPHSLEKFNPYYLGYVLRSPKIRKAIMKEGQGISRINLAASRIENIPIPIPPVTVQIKVVDYLKKWDGMISANEKTLTGLISLKKAFLQSLFI